MTKSGAMLITFAWIMEIVGVTGGAINSTYTTFGDDLPTSFAGYIPAVPMAALAAAEFGRVPLASVVYTKHRLMQVVAVLGIIALGYIAVENWTFGFERVVNLRLKPVNAASGELQRAEAELSRLKDQLGHTASSGDRKRDELRVGIAQRDTSIAELSKQVNEEAEVHRTNLEGIREACRIIRDKCMVPRSQTEDTRYAAVVSRLGSDLEGQREDRKRLQSQIDALVSADAADTTEIDRKIVVAAAVVTEARRAKRAAADENQIYRLAANWYGVSTSDVTPRQFAMARWVFSTFSAIAVALAGSVAALVYYSSNRVPGRMSFLGRLAAKVARARRGYYARKRKPIKLEVAGPERVVYRDGKEPPVVIEREVVRPVDQIVLIPRWGISMPFHVNSLIRKGDRPHGAQPQEGNAEEFSSNVTQIKKAH
jgi:hypothetical protein